MKAFTFILRFLFGALFIWSGVAKIKDPISFADAVRNFQIVGDPIAPALALFIPWLELIAGVAVMIWTPSRFGRAGALILVLSLIVFTLGIASAWFRGLDISCGCFSDTEKVDYLSKFLQNFALLGVGLFLLLKTGKEVLLEEK